MVAAGALAQRGASIPYCRFIDGRAGKPILQKPVLRRAVQVRAPNLEKWTQIWKLFGKIRSGTGRISQTAIHRMIFARENGGSAEFGMRSGRAIPKVKAR